jgi:hypothetical protein
MRILSLDVGTTETAYALMDHSLENPLMEFAKLPNEEIELLIYSVGPYPHEVVKMAYEEFASYGMPIGQTTMKSIWWNGYFCKCCEDAGIEYIPILRKDVKMHLCGTMKAKDCNIRQALIDRYGEPGTKACPGILHGVSKDVWSAIAINVTYWESVK